MFHVEQNQNINYQISMFHVKRKVNLFKPCVAKYGLVDLRSKVFKMTIGICFQVQNVSRETEKRSFNKVLAVVEKG